MNTYELTVIVPTRDAESHVSAVKDNLSKHAITILEDASPGVKRLAYEIAGHTEGYYCFFIIEAQPDAIARVNADFRLNHNILRHLFIRKLNKSTA